MRAFFDGVWKRDVEPLLTDDLARWRAAGARVAGKAASATGTVLDKAFGLKGRPFTRALAVFGSTVGAILPDAWRSLAAGSRRVVELIDGQVKRALERLPEQDALDMLGLKAGATRADLREAWHEAARRYHPDKAVGEAQRVEFHYRFLAFQAAYERLNAAFEEGRLPR